MSAEIPKGPIAVDVMGGDKGPGVVIQGVLDALAETSSRFLLVGHEDEIRSELKSRGAEGNPCLEVLHAEDVITMEDSPVEAVREKTKSSLVMAARAVREGRAAALISPGNTGAVLAAGTLLFGRIRGVERPGIATVLPCRSGHSVLIDVGANVDCRPTHLLRFGIMGIIYARTILGIREPRLGVLSVGEERGKGNELSLQTLALFDHLFASPAGSMLGRFLGNVEGREVFNGRADVVVCDGFTGNAILKSGEALAFMIFDLLKDRLTSSPFRKVTTFLLTQAFREFKKLIDYTEYGGAPLLGVKHPCIICHGSSGPKAIKSAVRVARESIEFGIPQKIEAAVRTI